ncbi:zinc-binding dehydrogenase [Streptomyces avicenniae]|uniref:zinc-binding dehydrogenase n=1 Tax=Streptomyces avicenniae TaxID=500153 RepID=UPI00069B1102|nr:zinc-binding dehydrogenase [Streptomyces avicenniae]
MATPTGEVTAAALVWTGGGRFETHRVPLPEPEPGEALVRVALATVCGSDLHTVTGRRPGPCPGILGHEAVGEVVAAGPGARAVDGAPLRPGDRVVWGVVAGCGRCDRCAAGRTAKCRSLTKIGHRPFEPDRRLSGCYASHVHLPRGTPVVRVPSGLPDAVAAPAACATATVAAAVELAGGLAGRRVLVSGAGMLGLTAVAWAADAGAAEVVALDVEPERLALAGEFGATRTVVATQDGEVGEVDAALEFSGASAAVARVLDALDVGGTAVLAGSVTPGPAVPLDPQRLVRGWQTVRGVHNYEPRHLVAAVDFLARTRDRRPWTGLVAEPVTLDALAPLLNRPRTPARTPRWAVRP